MYISCFLCYFHLRWVANANPVSSGILQLLSGKIPPSSKEHMDDFICLILFMGWQRGLVVKHPLGNQEVGDSNLTTATEVEVKIG